ncbi:MAG: hypothetical protein AAB685_02470 [Patescibacteria group bacterium]
MNPVTLGLKRGLKRWQEVADLNLLKVKGISVPRIFVKAKGASSLANNQTIIIASGLHLEETSGPLLLLDPSSLLPKLQPALQKNISFLIYPVINNYGLKYSPSGPEKLLRNNKQGINYNDGWGLTQKKCLEVSLVEKDILEFGKKQNLSLVLSLHEDSTAPGKGYLWINATNAKLRRLIQKNVTTSIDTSLLIKTKAKSVQGGKVEAGFMVVNAKDKGSFENWLADDLKVPTILSEAPFGLDLSTRKNFHSAIIASCINSRLRV